jgi:hypothetical protein
MGCGCGKGKTAQAPGAGGSPVRRATVYQVMANNAIVSEHETLADARTAAVTAGGRVKVTSKLVV